MRLEDMKKDIPETPEFIHAMIQNEVKKQLQDTQVVNIRKRKIKKMTGTKIAAAIVVCILATSTIVYAGVKLYHIFLEKRGTYSIITGIKTEDSNGKLDLPEKIHEISITTGYVPEGMEWIDESHLEYPEHGRMGGFSFDSVLLDENDLGKVMQDINVIEYEERIFGEYEGVYLTYNDLAKDGSFSQRIYLLCPEVYRIIIVYIGDDIVKEDAIKVVENLVIAEKDSMIDTVGMDTWSEMVSPEESLSEEKLISIEDGKLPVHQIGEAFDLSASGEEHQGNHTVDNKISVCVDSVQVADDLQLLNQNMVPEEWMAAVGADGKIVTNTLSYIKSGDGVDTVDKIVKTESVRQKLVYVSATYTNTSDKEINHILYMGTLMLLDHEDGRYRIYDPKEQSGNGYDRIIWDSVAKTAEMTYRSVSENYGNGGNYISALKPEESIQVNMAWIVNENDLDHMYLNLNSDGAANEFTDLTLRTGLVDICQ